MNVRKNIYHLDDNERFRFFDALFRIKNSGVYDEFVDVHSRAMFTPTPAVGEPYNIFIRNAAHRGPSFLTWHREYLRLFELELQKEVPGVTLPYWDSAADAALDDPKTAPLWTAEYVGGSGVEENNYEVADGPFTRNSWPVREDLGGPVLRRRLGVADYEQDGEVVQQHLEISGYDEVNAALAETTFDSDPWRANSEGFRNNLEGWRPRPDGQFTGSRMHNIVHLWVAGRWFTGNNEAGEPQFEVGSIGPSTSPNDPVFFLHHCFVDKIWADWQDKRREEDPDGYPHYQPISGGPYGHNLHDVMPPWHHPVTAASVLDVRALGYEYAPSSETQVVNSSAGESSTMIAKCTTLYD